MDQSAGLIAALPGTPGQMLGWGNGRIVGPRAVRSWLTLRARCLRVELDEGRFRDLYVEGGTGWVPGDPVAILWANAGQRRPVALGVYNFRRGRYQVFDGAIAVAAGVCFLGWAEWSLLATYPILEACALYALDQLFPWVEPGAGQAQAPLWVVSICAVLLSLAAGGISLGLLLLGEWATLWCQRESLEARARLTLKVHALLADRGQWVRQKTVVPSSVYKADHGNTARASSATQ